MFSPLSTAPTFSNISMLSISTSIFPLLFLSSFFLPFLCLSCLSCLSFSLFLTSSTFLCFYVYVFALSVSLTFSLPLTLSLLFPLFLYKSFSPFPSISLFIFYIFTLFSSLFHFLRWRFSLQLACGCPLLNSKQVLLLLVRMYLLHTPLPLHSVAFAKYISSYILTLPWYFLIYCLPFKLYQTEYFIIFFLFNYLII